METKEAAPNGRYTEEFKTEAIRLALSTGGNAAAKRLRIPQSTRTNWVRRRRDGAADPGAGAAVSIERPRSQLEAENARLRRELARAKLDLEIAKEAARISRRNRGEMRLDRAASRRLRDHQDVPAAFGHCAPVVCSGRVPVRALVSRVRSSPCRRRSAT